MTRLSSARATYLVVTVVLILAGLLSRSHVVGLPPTVAKYAGSILWGAMVYFVVAALLPDRERYQKAVVAAVIAISVEFSQLVHTGWLDGFRRTMIGVLLIGRFFSWWDIVCYLIGLSAAVVVDRLVVRPPNATKRSA